MKKILSVLATLVLLGQSAMTSVVYAQEAIDEGSTPETAVESVVEESNPDNGGEDVSPVVEEPTVEETLAEPEVLEETVADEELASESETEALDQEPVAETTAEEENVEEPADVVEPVEEPEVPAIVKEPVAETPVEEETVTESEELSAIAMVVETVLEREPLTGWAGGIYVTVEDPLGGLPEGVKMVLTPVAEEDVFDLIDSSLDAKVTKVVAIDITFYDVEGEKVEPTQPINVKMVAGNMPEAQSVVHIDAEYNDEKIEVGEAEVEEIVAEIDGDTAKFEAESFSIYAFVVANILTVNLYNGGTEPVIINVKSVSELVESEDHASIVYDPGVTLKEGEVFRGWTGSAEYTTGDAENPMTIADVRSLLAREFPLVDDKTLNFHAMIFNQRTVTYYDDNNGAKGPVRRAESVLFRGSENPSYVISEPYTAEDGEKFMGWKDIKTETEYGNGSGLILDRDYELKADVVKGQWLVYVENAKGATYKAPDFIRGGENTVKPKDPERRGYTFGGWFTDAACTTGNEFEFGHPLEEKTTIYAKWTQFSQADYTVIIWKQNVDGGEKYDFEEVITVNNGNVGSNIDTISSQGGNGDGRYARINGRNYQYKGFHLDRYDTNVPIAPEGNSVVNVYYNRNEYTLTFQDHPYTATTNNNGTQYGLVNGQYVQLTRHGIGNYYRTYGNNTRYNGTRYTQGNGWTTVKEIKALYEQNISGNFPIVGTNGATYNHGERWDPQSDTPFSEVLVYIDVMQAANVTFHLDIADRETKHIHYYIEALPGQTSTRTYNDMGFVEYKSMDANYSWFTEAEDYINLVGFSKGGNTYPPEAYSSNGTKLNSVWNNGDATNVYCYYTRDHHSIVYMDGKYIDGDGNYVDGQSSRGELGRKDNINYQSDLSGYNKGGADFYNPTYAGFVLSGWYIDEACTQPYTFTTMPSANLTVYAKWVQKQYRVFLHPNAGTDSTLDWGTGNVSTSFRVDNGEGVSLLKGLRHGFELVGWFTDPGFTNPFNDGTKLNDTIVTTEYDKTTQSTELDNRGNSTGSINKDLDRFWITNRFDLYAKWRGSIDGAEGINVVYVDQDEETVIYNDPEIYADSAAAVAIAAPNTAAPEGKQFKYWKVNKSGLEVYPGGTFTVLLSNAEVDDLPQDEIQEGSDITKKYTITLVAVYGDVELAAKTTIQYCNKRANPECGDQITVNVNEDEIVLEDEPTADTGYVFSGWRIGDKVYPARTTGFAADDLGINDGANKIYAVWDCDSEAGYEDPDNDGECTIKTFTVRWLNDDGLELEKDENVAYGSEPSYDGATPTKTGDAQYTYEFAGWSPATGAVEGDIDYTATYSSSVNKYTVRWLNDDGSELEKDENVAYGSEPSYDGTTPTKTKTGYEYTHIGWNPTVAVVTGNATYTATFTGKCATDYHDQALEQTDTPATVTELVCVSNTGAEAKCKAQLPENADAVIDTYTPTWTDKGWSTEPAWALKGDECTYKCKNGYHLNANGACERDSTGGGGGGSGGSHPDDCPNGDNSGSRYDGTCDAPGGGGSDDEEIEFGGQVSDKCSVSGSNLSAEEIEAYLYACENDITTIRDINEARLGDYLNRAEMAKIVSVFATKELGMKPNTSKDCSNFADSMNGWSQEMKDFMVMSCQLELMGIHTTNYEAIPDFMPAKRVSRAEFGTILSRILWGDKYEGTNDNYYFRHLDALKANNIITNIDPNITEYRSWVLLMIYRSVSVIKQGGTRKTDSIEQEVTEELENGTGAVAEIEAEVETGSTIGMPNPASVYCEEQGGTVNLETSMCKLADGTEVDEWEYYRANNKSEEEATTEEAEGTEEEPTAEAATGDVVEG